MIITGRKISAEALDIAWPGVIVSCAIDKKTRNTTVTFNEDSPVKDKSESDIIKAQDDFETAQPWGKLRYERNVKLDDSDWVSTKAIDSGADVPNEWVTYRQTLRDLPANTSDPANPTWPDAPA